MLSPFPGMNPYLEHPDLWPGVHHYLISEIARFLSPQLRPKYRVAVEVRMYESNQESMLVGIPDVIVKSRQIATDLPKNNVAVAARMIEPIRVKIPVPLTIKEGYLEVREVGTETVVTTIEILSPANKGSGKGRDMYDNKRNQILETRTNLVEIDMLRTGNRMEFFCNNLDSHYRILVCRGNSRPYGDLYAFNVQDIIPPFALPLRSDDIEPIINLQTLLNEIYDVYGYDLVVDYSQNPIPRLSEADGVWVDSLLRDRGLR